MSLDNRISNFEQLIQILASQTGYAPNDTDLKVTTLNTILTDLKTKIVKIIITVREKMGKLIEYPVYECPK